MEPLKPSAQPVELESLVTTFLTELLHTNHAVATQKAYQGDLLKFCQFCRCQATPEFFKPQTVRTFLANFAQLSPASRARKEAALASFFGWAYKRELITTNPLLRLERVKLDPPAARGLERQQVEAILAAIPVQRLRDRLLFRLLFETGLRVGEALTLYVEDLDLSPDDEHLVVCGKGGRRRTVLLDAPSLVVQLHQYLKRTGYKHGALFRAEKNYRGGPLRYQSVRQLWVRYAAKAGISCTLHQLRHSHATELINQGVSLGTIRKRLGHKNLQTTLRYAEQADDTADNELRAWRRRQTADQNLARAKKR